MTSSSEAAPAERPTGSPDSVLRRQAGSGPLRRALVGISQNGWLQTTVSFLVAAILWEFSAYYLIAKPILFSPLGSIAKRAIELWQAGELQYHIWVSFIEFAGGFGLAIVIGIGLGVAFAASRFMRNFFEPWISMLYATPIIALGPLFILWLGIGVASKIAIVFLTAVFPILINTVVGLTATERTLIDVARSLGATNMQIYTKIRIPGATSYVVAGLRLSVARALVGVVVAELFGARAGLGFLILTSAQNFDTPALFVGVIIFAIAGVASVSLLKWLEKYFSAYRFQENGE